MLFLLLLNTVLGANVTKYVCENGNSINFQQTCNGKMDCEDGSDEIPKLCKNVICPTKYFRCFYGACISKDLKCNGKNDCADGSDERQCEHNMGNCKKNEFKCLNGECISFEKMCNGITNCKDKSDKNVCTKISCPSDMYRCKIGGCIHFDALCNGHIDCVDGSDESQLLCGKFIAKVNVFCPPINLTRISAVCEIPSGPSKGLISCTKPMPPGTVVLYKCRPYYIPAKSHSKNKNMLCQADGTWNKEVLKCDPDCGITSDALPLITNGWFPLKSQHPWHAILYILENGKWEFSCGGSLISEKIVLTAAHCVWEVHKSLLQIGLGKHYSDYNKNEIGEKFRNISEVIVQPLYQDLIGNYGSDIAILVMERPVQFNAIIRPICIDWTLDDITNHLQHNNLGLIVGTGLTESNTFSEKMRAIYLPVVDDGECIAMQNRDFKKYVTFTSFCAGWANGTGVCNGDSGGGLVFSNDHQPNRYTIQGIVSVSPRRPGTSFCDPDYYTIFTKVGIYVEWIFKVLKQIHQDDLYDIFDKNIIV